MATIPFVPQAFNGEGVIYKAVGLATSDETSVLSFVSGEVELAVHIYGTVGGSTVRVQGSLLSSTFSIVDDAYGVLMSYTAIGVLKPVGPPVSALKVTIFGGAGASVDVDVLVRPKVRP